MVILDTDTLSILFRDDHSLLPRLKGRLHHEPENGHAPTVVCLQEMLGGWMSVVNSARTQARLLLGYEPLRVAVVKCSAMQLLPYDTVAHDLFESLRMTCRRIGTMDLRIACIAIANNALLLTRNVRDFRQVPRLAFEDWSR